MITAAETCDFINEVVCKPANVKELFEFTNFAGTQISRTEVLILLAAIIPVVVVFFGLRKKSVVPGKLQSAVESIFSFVKDEIALGVIGRGGEKFTPYLVSIFLFILVGNLFEVAPLINFPVTSRMALPLFLCFSLKLFISGCIACIACVDWYDLFVSGYTINFTMIEKMN